MGIFHRRKKKRPMFGKSKAISHEEKKVKQVATKKIKLPGKEFMEVPAHLKGKNLAIYLEQRGVKLPSAKPYAKARIEAQENAINDIRVLIRQSEVMSKVPEEKIKKQLNGWKNVHIQIAPEIKARVDEKVDAFRNGNSRTKVFIMDDLWLKAEKGASIAKAALYEIWAEEARKKEQK